MCTALGYSVETLKRIRIMNITLANLPVGKWRYFTAEESKTIDSLVSTSSKTEEASYDNEE
jgi:23S rRNA pseudouridine2604 synthase